MSVEDIHSVDIIGIERDSGKVILTIADHLEWADQYSHLKTLQMKLNTYIEFIESGEMHAIYPSSVGREPMIEIVFKYEPTESAETFIREATNALQQIGIELRYEVKDPGVPKSLM